MPLAAPETTTSSDDEDDTPTDTHAKDAANSRRTDPTRTPAHTRNGRTAATGTIGRYLEDIGQRQMLTHQQEADLSKRIQAGQAAQQQLTNTTDTSSADVSRLQQVTNDGQRALQQLCAANLRLVVSVARRRGRISRDHLLEHIQNGNVGLIRAAEKFDPTRGYRFTTYAMWWIKQAIERGDIDGGHLIRIPHALHHQLRKLAGTDELHNHDSEGRLLDARRARWHMLDLHGPAQPAEDGNMRPLHETLTDDTINIEADVAEADSNTRLAHAVQSLDARQTFVLCHRFGLFEAELQTFDTLAEHLGVSRDTVRRIEHRALQQLTELLADHPAANTA